MSDTIRNEAANQARGLAIDAVHTCSSGHLGLPLGAAEIGASLFSTGLNFDPKDPKWPNRDRFIYLLAMAPCSFTLGCTCPAMTCQWIS